MIDDLFPLVYGELRAVAQARLGSERADHTLNATALVHEAYLKLVNQKDVDWQNRAQFFAIAARAMRRLLIDYAKARRAEKRGGGQALVTFDEESAPARAVPRNSSSSTRPWGASRRWTRARAESSNADFLWG